MSALDPERQIRLSPVWRKGLLPVAIAVSAVMILLGALDAAKSTQRLPPQIAFVPVESRFAVVSSSLGSLWRNLGSHMLRLKRDPVEGSYWDDVNATLREISSRCIDMKTTDGLSASGFDPAHGISLALIGNRELNLLATVPVLDRKKALQAFESLSLDTVPIRLTAPLPGAAVAAFHVAPNKIENGVLCMLGRGAPFNGEMEVLTGPSVFSVATGQEIDAELELFFSPRGAGAAQVALSCEAELLDGSRVPCNCSVDYSQCSWPFVNDSHGEGLELVVGEGDPESAGPETLWRDQNELYVGFVDDRMVLASSRDLVLRAAEMRQGRRARMLGDNALLELVEQFHAGIEAGEATVLGLLRGLEEPVAGTLPFALNASPERLQLRAALPTDTLGIQVLDQLVSKDVADPPELRVDAPLSVLINDTALGDYYEVADQLYANLVPILASMEEEFADENFTEPTPPVSGAGSLCRVREEAPEPHLTDFTGNFAPLVSGLTRHEQIGALQGYLLSVRDGVPEVVLVQHGLSDDMLEQLITKTRAEMKHSRDSQILCHARNRFWSDTGGPEYPVQPQGLLPYLGGEGPALIARYDLQRSTIVTLNERKRFLDSWVPTAPMDFDTPRYRAASEPDGIAYLPPPFEANDQRYLVPPDAQVDTEALRNDAFRLAFMRRADGAVLFGTDADTVRRFLTLPPISTRATPEGVLHDKLSADGNPEHLVTLALLYPQDTVRSLVTEKGFEVLDQYRVLQLGLRPAQGFTGVVLEMLVSRD